MIWPDMMILAVKLTLDFCTFWEWARNGILP